MDRDAHFHAFKTRLEQSPLPVYDHDAPLDAKGQIVHGSYVILYDLGPDGLDDQRFTAGQRADSTATYRAVAKVVAESPFAVRQVLKVVDGLLIGARLTVTGRALDPVRLDSAGAIKRDTDISPPLYFAENDYTAVSREA